MSVDAPQEGMSTSTTQGQAPAATNTPTLRPPEPDCSSPPRQQDAKDNHGNYGNGNNNANNTNNSSSSSGAIGSPIRPGIRRGSSTSTTSIGSEGRSSLGEGHGTAAVGRAGVPGPAGAAYAPPFRYLPPTPPQSLYPKSNSQVRMPGVGPRRIDDRRAGSDRGSSGGSSSSRRLGESYRQSSADRYQERPGERYLGGERVGGTTRASSRSRGLANREGSSRRGRDVGGGERGRGGMGRDALEGGEGEGDGEADGDMQGTGRVAQIAEGSGFHCTFSILAFYFV